MGVHAIKKPGEMRLSLAIMPRIGSSSPAVRGRRKGGFTTAELLVAFALLAVIITVVIGLFVKLMNASSKGLDQTVALDIAQNKLDFAAQSTPSKWTFWASEEHSVTDPRTPTPFYY
ncbi:unnamed protein product, partial [Phaeothamnion confervicola]